MIKAVIIVLIGIAVAGCPGRAKLKAVPINQACEIAWKIFYQRDGSYSFTDREIDNLRQVNVDKNVDFKRWFKSECPNQYARTVGGKKK